MREVLLQELSNSDIDWIIANGYIREIEPGTVVVETHKLTDTFYIILEGKLITTVTKNINNPLTRAFATLEAEEKLSLEIMRLSNGEVIGENFLVFNSQIRTTTIALEKSLVIAIPMQKLEKKLKNDKKFAAHFHRSIAILYSNRLENIVNYLGRSKIVPIQPIKNILIIFGQLNESDINWFIENGIIHRLSQKDTLICQGGAVDALYLLLRGKMAISVSQDNNNPLTRIFATLEEKQSLEQEIAKLYKGEIIGEGTFVDRRLPYTTVKAVEDSVVLAIPRPKLIAKLEEDIGFSARFYQAITTLLGNRWERMISRISYGRRNYNQGFPLDENVAYDDEIDSKSMEKISIAAVRFDWMLNTLKIV